MRIYFTHQRPATCITLSSNGTECLHQEHSVLTTETDLSSFDGSPNCTLIRPLRLLLSSDVYLRMFLQSPCNHFPPVSQRQPSHSVSLAVRTLTFPAFSRQNAVIFDTFYTQKNNFTIIEHLYPHSEKFKSVKHSAASLRCLSIRHLQCFYDQPSVSTTFNPSNNPHVIE